MATPIERAAEEMAPPPPRTSFFTGTPSVISQLYTGRRGAESAAALAEETSRLGRDRWSRTQRDRTLIEWGREDEDYRARKDFEASRGEFLRKIGQVVPDADDYEKVKAELLADPVARKAMDDDAVRAMFTSMDAAHRSYLSQKNTDARYEEMRARDSEKTLADARKAFTLAGGNPKAAATIENPFELYTLAGEYRRLNDAEKAKYNSDLIEGRQINIAEARGTGDKEKAEKRRKALETVVMDDGRFPETALTKDQKDEGRKQSAADRLDAEMNRALNSKEEDYVNAVGAISERGKAARREVWREAQAMGAELGIAPAPAAPAPAAAQPGAQVFPTKHPSVKNADGSQSNVVLAGFNLDGREYVIPTMVDGKRLTNDQAVAIARKNGLDKYPSFETPEEADAWAKQFHGRIDQNGRISGGGPAAPAPTAPEIPADAPRRKLKNGSEAVQIGGKWFLVK